jgi:GntR family transcriptional regulator
MARDIEQDGAHDEHQGYPTGDHEPPLVLTPSSLANDQFLIDEVWSLPRGRAGTQHYGDTMVVTMRDVNLDRHDTMSLHDQVAAEIRRDIANGDVRPGERLPPARDMAAVLGVHTNTVLRALRILREEGVLEFRRGRGVTVSAEPERGVIWAQAQELLAQARQFGLQREDVVSIIESLS